MDISLTPQLEDLIRRKVESGLYSNASDVVREALRLLSSQEEEREVKLMRLRRALEVGEESGEAVDFSMDGLIAALPEGDWAARES